MTFGDAVSSGFDHYTKFDGRANRPAFWYWVLFEIAVLVVASIVDSIIGARIFYIIAALGLVLPGLSVSIRRLHDTGRSGWWILIGLIPIIGTIILIVFYASEGDPGENEYGPPMSDPVPATA